MEIIVVSRPVVIQVRGIPIKTNSVPSHVVHDWWRCRRKCTTILTIDQSGYALSQAGLGDSFCVGQHHQIAMHVSINKTRHHIMAGHIHFLNAFGIVEPANVTDHGIGDGHICPVWECAGAVDDPTAAKNPVEMHVVNCPDIGF